MTDPIRDLLRAYRDGAVDEDEVLRKVIQKPYEDHLLGRFDHLREARTGVPEVILAEGKDPIAVAEIFLDYQRQNRQLIATRVTPQILSALQDQIDDLHHFETARVLTTQPAPDPEPYRSTVLVVSAGALDRPVAEEAAVTCRLFGNPTERLYDVGVAGIARLITEFSRLDDAGIVIVCAGMDGALPSVIGGLIHQPLIAVPTSVGYGSNLGGIAPLLTMLNACSPGTAVMNIDNGFGAAALATKINQLAQRAATSSLSRAGETDE